jgi:signal transduction histidine kinase
LSSLPVTLPSPTTPPLPRPGVRTQLTLLYGGLFLASGVLLLAMNYALVQRSLHPQPLEVTVLEPGEPVPKTTAPNEFFVPLPPKALSGSDAMVRTQPLTVEERKLLHARGLAAAKAHGIEGATVKAGVGDTGKAPEVAGEFRRLQRQVEERVMSALVTRSGLALAVMAVASMGLGWLMAGRILRPLKRITTTARRLSGSNLHERIRLRGPDDELKELADTFDRMLDRLDAAFAAQRRFVANASHELRTPLTIVRTEVDVALADPDATARQLRAMAERVREASQRSERLIESLLLLARSERRPDAGDPLDLASAATDALDALPAEVRGRELAVETTLEPAVVAGDRALLERLVANLVENAVRHNVNRGWVRVTTGTTAGQATVTVANSGAVIPPEEVAGLLEPFRRRSRARSGDDRGAGLGLSIVRAVTESHGGHLTVSARPAGGLEVHVELPAARLETPAGGAGAWYDRALAHR